MIIQLPDWVEVWQQQHTPDKVDFLDASADEYWSQKAIELADLNVQKGDGGPFGALVINHDNNALVSCGVNQVVNQNCSLLHAEIIAIAKAQQHLQVYSLKQAGQFTLYSSCEPCSMCLGATGWAGLVRLVYCARGDDAEAIGFYEGVKPDNWQEAYHQHHQLQITADVQRDKALEVFAGYQSRGGKIYNP